MALARLAMCLPALAVRRQLALALPLSDQSALRLPTVSSKSARSFVVLSEPANTCNLL